jgi:ribosomal protein S27E
MFYYCRNCHIITDSAQTPILCLELTPEKNPFKEGTLDYERYEIERKSSIIVPTHYIKCPNCGHSHRFNVRA